jgi:cell wall-associated NlpC family hydrolase
MLPILAAVPFILPGKPFDQNRFRARYLREMEAMEGVPYLWGAESRKAVDCSGLPRRALRSALLAEGCDGANGRAFRAWAEQWWFDTSARAMGEGYRGFTRSVGIEGPLRKLDFSLLQPGDLAVTESGVHVMIHLGEGRWIQADPKPGKVVISKPESDPCAWFDMKVSIHRWTLFD